MSLKIKYLDVPYGAQEAAQVVGQGQPFSVPGLVAAGTEDAAYATLESAGWPLDGERRLLPDAPEGMWWSEGVSDGSGVFAVPPVLEFSFPTTYTATGISFTFCPAAREWCSRVRVAWLRGTALLAQAEMQPDGPQWTHPQTVEDFDTVRVELLQTNLANHFAKVQRIEIGQTIWFLEDEIAQVQIVSEADHTLNDLTVDTMTVKVRDKKGRSLRPQENQRLELYRDETPIAAQYVQKCTRESGQWYTFSCQSAIGLLEDDYLGGVYNAVPAGEVLKDILSGIEYEMDTVFEAQPVTGYLPVCTRRQALQQLAFALGAAVSTRGDGKIRILPPETGISHTFRKEQIFQGGQLETQPRVYRVEVAAHSYTLSAERETLLDAEPVEGEDVLITFSEPHHSYQITGGTITGSGANWVTVTANGAVTLTAGKYLHSTVLHGKQNPAASASERGNVLCVEEATLVGSKNVNAVLRRIYDAAGLRQVLNFDAVIAGQCAGQMAVAEDPWGGLVQGCITSMDLSLTHAGQTADITLCGRQVPAQTAAFYAGELYCGDKEVAYLCS